MAREAHIEDPVKVTLYLPRVLAGDAKEHAKDVEKTSLSKLVTELLEERISGNVKRTLELPPEVDSALKALAKKNKKSGSVENFLLDLIASATEKPEAKKPTPRKRATAKKRPTRKAAAKKK